MEVSALAKVQAELSAACSTERAKLLLPKGLHSPPFLHCGKLRERSFPSNWASPFPQTKRARAQLEFLERKLITTAVVFL
jgi:hypothetical protein